MMKEEVQERLWRSCRGVVECVAFFHWPRLRSAGGFILEEDEQQLWRLRTAVRTETIPNRSISYNHARRIIKCSQQKKGFRIPFR